MDKSWIGSSDTFSAQYILGVDKFLDFAFTDKLAGSKIYCPCTKCKNRFIKKREDVREHCLLYGFEKNYKNWRYHGEVQDNTTLPPEAKSIVLHTLNDMWRDWKRRLKAVYFTPYKDDPDYDFSQQPNEQVEMNQWLDLVEYWKKQEVQDLAKLNASNRARKKHLHRTGKKPFQRLKQEMKADGKDTTKPDVFVESRTCGKRVNMDIETIDLIRGFEEELLKKPESEQTSELKDDLFVNAFGEDKPGRGRCTGRGITHSKLDNTSSLKMSNNEIAEQVEELWKLKDELTQEKKLIEQMKLELCNQKEEINKDKEQVVNEVRAELKNELDHMKINMDFVMSLIDPTTIQAALSRVPEHNLEVINVLSGSYGSQLNTDESTLQKQHQAHSFPNISKSHELVGRKSRRENDLYNCGSVKVGSNVILHSSEIPKETVAEGVLLSIDPNERVDNIALGIEFVKVVIRKAIKSDYLLSRLRRGVNTVGDAVGKVLRGSLLTLWKSEMECNWCCCNLVDIYYASYLSFSLIFNGVRLLGYVDIFLQYWRDYFSFWLVFN